MPVLLTDDELRVWIRFGAALKFGTLTVAQARHRITNFGFHNFSTVDFDQGTRCLLGMGLKFVPFPRARSTDDLLLSFDRCVRSIRLAVHFAGRNQQAVQGRAPVPLRFLRKCSWFNPPLSGLEHVVRNARREFEFSLRVALEKVPVSFRNASRIPRVLRDLVRPDVTFKMADKNLGLVCVQRDWYEAKCMEYLHDVSVFEPVRADALGALHARAKTQFQDFCDKAGLQCDFESGVPSSWHPISFQSIPIFFLYQSVENSHEMVPAEMYGIIKVHKQPMSIRPITPAHSVIGAVISDWVCAELQKFVWASPFVLKDSKTLVRRLEDLRLDTDRRYAMITFDVENMYPSLPRERLRARLLDFFSPHLQGNLVYLNWLLDCIEWVQEFHLIKFKDSFFRQISGTAMGIHFGPLVANAFMASLEAEFQRSWSQSGHSWPLVYSRYIDDGFVLLELPNDYVGAAVHCPLVRQFVDGISRLDPNIRLKVEISEQSAVMLDLLVQRSGSGMFVSTFSKPMNKFLYVPFSSCHTRANLKAFIKAELLRFAVTNTHLVDFSKARLAFFERLIARGYPDSFLRPQFDAVVHSDRTTIFARDRAFVFPPPLRRTVFFKTTTDRHVYANHLDLPSLLYRCLRNVLESPRVQPALSADRPLMVSYKRAPNLNDVLRAAERRLVDENVAEEDAGVRL
jgi:hypothetical protein